jgi:hypothetical protein
MSWEIVGRELIGHEKKKKKEQKRVWKEISEKNWESSQFLSLKKIRTRIHDYDQKKLIASQHYTMSSLSVCL